MENASKALIIAGAILISILLISIGIILINSGSDVAEAGTSSMASQKIQTFNSQFTAYEGRKKGSELRGLFNAIESSNAVDEAHQVDATGVIQASDLVSSRTYTVTVTYCPSTVPSGVTSEPGYVYLINIV